MLPPPIAKCTRSIDIFWGEMSACDHSVQIYQDDDEFIDALEGYVAAGIRQGDAIVLIATPSHLLALEQRLERNGFSIETARARKQYFTFDAEATLAKFMVNGWPDEERFKALVLALLADARQHYRTVRAFGEMVALLWARGDCGATVHLEHLWSRLCQQNTFSLFCAYPRTGFTQDSSRSIADVCSAHSRVFELAPAN